MVIKNLQAILTSVVFLLVAALGSAQDKPASSPDPNQAAASQEAPTPGGAVSGENEDSPDIPPFARGLIDEGTYLRLRDELTAIKRGLPTLLLDRGARSRAIRQLEQQEKSLLSLHAKAKLAGKTGALAVPVPSWNPLGPAPIPNGQTGKTQVAVSGRVTAIAVDPFDANTVYVGTAQGGLYRTKDGGTNWTAIMDSALSLAIGAVTINPQDHDIVFVGTGEGNGPSLSSFGVGLYIIRGATQAKPALTGPFNSDGTKDVFTGRSITQILVNPGDGNKILISTVAGGSGMNWGQLPTANLPTRGVYLSINALSFSAPPTFMKQTIQTAYADRDVTDMAMDPGNPSTIVVNVNGLLAADDGGIWVSTSGDPWAGSASWTPTFPNDVVAKLAVNRSGQPSATTFFATFDKSVLCPPKVGKPVTVKGTMWKWKSTDDPKNWVEVPAARGFCGDQCDFDMSIAVDPGNVMNILLAGSAAPTPPEQTDGAAAPSAPPVNVIGKCGTGAMGKSTDGGTTFSPSENFLHADSHATVFAPSDPLHLVVYTGNDGGIFVSSDAGATWQSRNTTGFNATQFESLSLHSVDPNFMIGGTQDNGTEYMKSDGTWTRADYGDGGFSGIDQSSANVTSVAMYHTYYNKTNGPLGFARVTDPANATDDKWTAFGCGMGNPGPGTNGIDCSDNVLFYAPLALGQAVTPNTVYFGTDHLYRSENQGVNNVAVSQKFVPIPCSQDPTKLCPRLISAIGISAQDDLVRIVGLDNGQVFATTAGSTTLTNVTGAWAANMYIARTVIDPNNKNTAYVTLDGYGTTKHVWKTTNLSGVPPSWTAMSSGLPDIPVNAFAVDPGNSNYLYAGTDIGSYSSTDGGLTWIPYGTGLPRVAIFDLNIQRVAPHKVRVGTHGRGAWEIAAGQFGSTAGLTATSSSPDFDTDVTFTATLSGAPASKIPGGTVTFLEGATNLGSAPLDATGKATFQTSALAVGAHAVTAVYAGDSFFLGSTSPAATLNVGDYTLSADRTTAAVIAGSSATFALTVTPQGGFANPVVLSCSGLPLFSACSFSPPTVTPNGGAATSTMTITTTAHTTKTAMQSNPWGGAGSVFAAATGFSFLGMAIGGGTTGKKRLRRYCLRLLVILGLVVAIVGCGSTPTPDPTTGTPAGMSNVVVTSTSGPLTQTTSIAFSVR